MGLKVLASSFMPHNQQGFLAGVVLVFRPPTAAAD
jgi:hypothetical protein